MSTAKTIESETAAERRAREHVRDVLGDWFPSHGDQELDGIAELAWASTDQDLVPDRRAIAALAAARRRATGTAPPRRPTRVASRRGACGRRCEAGRTQDPARDEPRGHCGRSTRAGSRARDARLLAGVPDAELDRITASAWASTDPAVCAGDRRAIAALAAARAEGGRPRR